jgi:hypothetical protein
LEPKKVFFSLLITSGSGSRAIARRNSAQLTSTTPNACDATMRLRFAAIAAAALAPAAILVIIGDVDELRAGSWDIAKIRRVDFPDPLFKNSASPRSARFRGEFA